MSRTSIAAISRDAATPDLRNRRRLPPPARLTATIASSHSWFDSSILIADRVRNYSSRREQLRLLLLFVPLGLVILVDGRLRDPKTAERDQPVFHARSPRIDHKAATGRELADQRRPAVAESAQPRAPDSSPASSPTC